MKSKYEELCIEYLENKLNYHSIREFCKKKNISYYGFYDALYKCRKRKVEAKIIEIKEVNKPITIKINGIEIEFKDSDINTVSQLLRGIFNV